MLRDIGHFFLKWWNVFLYVGLFIVAYSILVTASPGTPGAGVWGDVLNGIGRFLLWMQPVTVFLWDRIFTQNVRPRTLVD